MSPSTLDSSFYVDPRYLDTLDDQSNKSLGDSEANATGSFICRSPMVQLDPRA